MKKKNIIIVDLTYIWDKSEVFLNINISVKESFIFGIFKRNKKYFSTIVPADTIDNDLTYISNLINEEAFLENHPDKMIINRVFKTHIN